MSREAMQQERNIVKRLRETASRGVSAWNDLMMEAAKEIEILTAQALYTAPVQRQPLTEKRIIEFNDAAFDKYMTQDARALGLARAIEAAHGIGGEK
ncbi:hypothetical protein UFOVP56_59 [uncultured Caudovirales phage]|uniref:Uncharacterized protein n=1 Tax=uncultured Caudovirales phage TaxID=2100421 RepID=A0A6J5T8Q8_9CAUD|nr:hypothetical protein UFOVP56_59 [uncultured Caudovirales phage]